MKVNDNEKERERERETRQKYRPDKESQEGIDEIKEGIRREIIEEKAIEAELEAL